MCPARLGRYPVHALSLSVLKLGTQDIYWMMRRILKHTAVSVMLATSIQQGQTLALFPYETGRVKHEASVFLNERFLCD